MTAPALQPAVAEAAARATDLLLREFPACTSILLTGSGARGDALVVDGRLLSDLDLLAVVPARRLPAAVAAFPGLAARISEAAGTKATLAPLPRFLLRRAPPTVFFHELRVGARTLHGPDLLEEIPWADPASIRRRDAVDILFNYLAEAFRIRDEHADALDAPCDASAARRLARCLVAIPDAALVLSGAYAHRLDERIARGLPLVPTALPLLARRRPGVEARLREAWEVRLGKAAPQGTLRESARQTLGDLAGAVEAAVDALRPGADVAEWLRRGTPMARVAQHRALRLAACKDLSALRPGLGPGGVQLLAYDLAVAESSGASSPPRVPRYLGRPSDGPDALRARVLDEWSRACPVVSLA